MHATHVGVAAVVLHKGVVLEHAAKVPQEHVNADVAVALSHLLPIPRVTQSASRRH